MAKDAEKSARRRLVEQDRKLVQQALAEVRDAPPPGTRGKPLARLIGTRMVDPAFSAVLLSAREALFALEHKHVLRIAERFPPPTCGSRGRTPLERFLHCAFTCTECRRGAQASLAEADDRLAEEEQLLELHELAHRERVRASREHVHRVAIERVASDEPTVIPEGASSGLARPNRRVFEKSGALKPSVREVLRVLADGSHTGEEIAKELQRSWGALRALLPDVRDAGLIGLRLGGGYDLLPLGRSKLDEADRVAALKAKTATTGVDSPAAGTRPQ